MTYALHPLCETLPDMPADQFRRLVDDIKANGLRHAIVLYEGKILDGRHRYRACDEAGITARFESFDGTDPLAFVLSENLARRHLSESQRAMVAAKLANLGQGQPKKDANLHLSSVTRTQASDLLGVSKRSVAAATEIKRKGIPALVQKVESGAITIHEAEKIAELGREAQTNLVAIDDRRQRQHALSSAINRSQAKKAVHAQQQRPSLPLRAPDMLVRETLSRLEMFTHNILGDGTTPEEFVDRFIAQVDWNLPRLPTQLQICARGMAAIALLYETLRAKGKVAA